MVQLVAIDPVFDSLHELQNRVMKRKDATTAVMLTCIPNLAEDYTIIEPKLTKSKYDHIIMSFSLHYIADTKKCIEFYSQYLITGGTFIILYIDTYDEELINKINTFPENDNKFNFKIDGDYVEVKLPFSGEESYREKRLSSATLNQIVTDLSLEVVFDSSFNKIIPLPEDYGDLNVLYSSIH